MMKIRRYLQSIGICIALTGLVSCGDEEKTIQTPFLELSVTEINFGMESGTQEVSVETNVEGWTAAVQGSNDTWCHVQPADDRLIVSVDANRKAEVRSANIAVVAQGLREELHISQLGTDKAILVAPTYMKVSSIGKDIEFTVTSNVEHLRIETPEWIMKTEEYYARSAMTDTTHPYTVTRNTGDVRTGEIVIGDRDTDVTAVLTIEQEADAGYQPGDTEGIKDDILIPIVRGEATHDVRAEAPFRYTYDGKNDDDDIFLSGTFDPDEGVSMTWYVGEETESINYLVYDPGRASNGRWGRTRIYWQAQGSTEFTELMEYDFRQTTSPLRVEFEEPLANPAAIRVVAYSGSGNLVSCNEMSFYATNPEQFDPTTLFTDATCSELKPGVTEREIEQCKVLLYRNIAYYMFHNRYEREFRIAYYKPYPHPDVQSNINRTTPYSLMDGVTGMVAEAGKPFIVFLGDEAGTFPISLNIMNLNVPGGDGFNSRQSYTLKRGYNRIEPTATGLVYVMYHTQSVEEAETLPAVKVHFASGKVNGYYDSQNEAHQGRWSQLINGTDYDYFDVVGKYAHLSFPTADFRQYAGSNIDELIGLYDEICRLEMEFMGLFKYESPSTPRIFRNRMHCTVMYTSYMYSTNYHTAYTSGTMNVVCNYDAMSQNAGNIWGPAHEIGHHNQTRPLLRWIGTTEVTNNILALYVQTQLFGAAQSRLITENRYNNGMTSKYSQPGVNHALFAGAEVFWMLVPFWQLQLYIAQVKGQTDFYPDMFEMARTKTGYTPQGPFTNNAEYIFNFVKEACRISGMDLTAFFDKWGFIDPMDATINDYGTQPIRITEADAEQVRNEIKAMGLPAPEENIAYICDTNVELFKDGSAAMSAGTATRNGNSVTVTGSSNVAAFEVQDADGKTVYVSIAPQFTLNREWAEGYVLKAVPARGAKVTVSIN